MATKIKVITTKDFLEVTPDGVIDITTSRKLIVAIARAERGHAYHELLVDFRDTQCNLTVLSVYHLAAELCQHPDTFLGKTALLVDPGVNFDRASFFETCANNRGYAVNAFTDYETAMRWLLKAEDLPVSEAPAGAVSHIEDGRGRTHDPDETSTRKED